MNPIGSTAGIATGIDKKASRDEIAVIENIFYALTGKQMFYIYMFNNVFK